MADPFARDFHLRLDIPDLKEPAPRPPDAPKKDAGTIRVLRDFETGAQAPPRTAPPPYTLNCDDIPIVLRRDDATVVEEKEQLREQLEQLIHTDDGVKAPAKPARQRADDRTGSSNAFIAIAAMAIGAFALTLILPSIFTRAGGDPAPVATVPAAIHPTKVEPFSDLNSAAVPQQLPAPAIAPPIPNEAKTAPVLDKPSDASSLRQGTALTAAEQAAVDRGLKELDKTAAINAQPRPAPNGPPLSEAEKASVERGLRELEKTAKRGKQQPRR